MKKEDLIITPTKLKMIKSYYEFHKLDEEIVSCVCFVCKKGLKIGDYIDELFPMSSINNKCRECRSKNQTRRI